MDRSGVSSENLIWGKDRGLVIYRIPKEKTNYINWGDKDEVEMLMRTYNQFVWTPVNLLTANSTLNECNFTEKFGRQYYQYKFMRVKCSEPLKGDLLLQKKSVDKYGGYYSSRYNISKDKETGYPRSVKGSYPWTNIDFETAKTVSATMLESETDSTHLMYGAEYDTRIKWVVESGTATAGEVTEDSTKLGNYHNKSYPNIMVKTGEDGCLNNIYGFAGNVDELTQEESNRCNGLIRGGGCNCDGAICNASIRNYYYQYGDLRNTGFRTTLCIE